MVQLEERERATAPTTLLRTTVVLAWLVVVGVLAQALLAGRALFVDPGLFSLHGGIGHGVLAIAVGTAIGAWVGRVGRATAGLATLTVLLLAAQTGLGYTGHRSGVALASALHVPLGTAIIGLAASVAVVLSLSLRVQR